MVLYASNYLAALFLTTQHKHTTQHASQMIINICHVTSMSQVRQDNESA